MAALDTDAVESADSGGDDFMSVTDLLISLLLVFIIMLMGFALMYKQAEAANRDEQADLKRRQDRLANERAVLQTRRDLLVREREAAKRQQDLLVLDREAAKREQERLAAEIAALKETQAQAARDRDEARQTLARIVAERAELERRRTGTIEALQQARLAVEAIDRRADKERELLQAIAARFNAIDAALEAEADPAGRTIRFSDAVLFADGQSLLTERGREIVARIGDMFAEILPCHAGPLTRSAAQRCGDAYGAEIDTLFIEGRAGRTGLDESAWRLSADRALETYVALTARRPEIRRIANMRGEPVIGVGGRGPDRSLDGQIMGRNRRIGLRFVFAVPVNEEIRRMERILAEALDR